MARHDRGGPGRRGFLGWLVFTGLFGIGDSDMFDLGGHHRRHHRRGRRAVGGELVPAPTNARGVVATAARQGPVGQSVLGNEWCSWVTIQRAVLLAQPDGEAQAAGPALRELGWRAAAQQGVREGDVVAGGDVELDDLEDRALRCHSKNGGHVSR